MPVTPLQANRSMATLNELMWLLTTAGEADRPRLWAIGHQFNGFANNYLREGGTREELAWGYGVSARQLRRWVSKFNEGGIPRLLERRVPKRGRKRKINRSDFREKILKLAEVQAEVQGLALG